jgi:futalosine hydrolase
LSLQRRILFVTAVDAETQAVRRAKAGTVVTAGIGRTNAAAATTETIVRDGPFDAVVSIGVGGALPDSSNEMLSIGDTVVATRCVYAEEGLVTPDGMFGMEGLGFPLGDFEGNAVPVDPMLLQQLSPHFATSPIATVATCSGTDDAARDIAIRTEARIEAMEGAAVVHAARRLQTAAIEVRVVSNTTGDRKRQQWDLPLALEALRTATERLSEVLLSAAAP